MASQRGLLLSTGTNAELDDLLEELGNRLQAGESLDLEAVVAQHPAHADDLRRYFPSLQVLAGFKHTPDQLAALGELGDFHLLREVGRGGMGIVYEAEQISLRRRVTLKVLPFAATMDPRHLQRFHNEARAAAGLHHANIVPVYFVGIERGVHFYAMQFIEGQSLAELIAAQKLDSASGAASARRWDETGGLTPRRSPDAVTQPMAAATTQVMPRDAAHYRRIAEWGIQAAEALEHAHGLGIVHRDIKPSNLMIDAAGKLWVTDFGLARTATDAGLTMTGDVLGTLRYMSPEQALAKHGLVDHRSDIYSLGATLYQLLTLRPVVDGNDREEILRKITFEEPPPPRSLDRGIPADLETIILKTLAEEPLGRYATAQELADDLRRFLDNRPIQARRPPAARVMAKWVRRHLGAVLVTVAVLLLATVALAVSAVLIWFEKERTTLALQEKKDALGRAEQQQRRAQGDFAKALNLLPSGLAKLYAEEGAQSPQMVHVREVLITHMEGFCRQFLEERPDDPFVRLETAWAYDHLGWYHWRHGQLAHALRAHETAVGIMDERAAQFPENAEYIYVRSGNRARLYTVLHRLGKYREGREVLRTRLELLRRCVELEPMNWNYLDELASSLTVCPYEELRDPEQALRLAQRAQSVVPPGATSLDTLGRAYYRNGNLELALASLEKALPLRGERTSNIDFTLVLVYVKLGEREKARRIYDEAVERLQKLFARDGRLRTDAWLEILWAEAAAALGLDDPAPVPPLH